MSLSLLGFPSVWISKDHLLIIQLSGNFCVPHYTSFHLIRIIYQISISQIHPMRAFHARFIQMAPIFLTMDFFWNMIPRYVICIMEINHPSLTPDILMVFRVLHKHPTCQFYLPWSYSIPSSTHEIILTYIYTFYIVTSRFDFVTTL